MRPCSVHISNFRCIGSSVLNLSDYCVLIGRNGSGKSSYLEALSFFFQPSYKVAQEDFCNHNQQAEIVVGLTFDALSPTELEQFRPYVQGTTLRVDKVARCENGSITSTYHGNRRQFAGFQHVRALSGRNLIAAYRELRNNPDYTDLAAVNSEADCREKLGEWEAARPERCEWQRDEGRFFGFTNVGSGTLSRYLRFVRIPARMGMEQHWTEQAGNTLRVLVDQLVRTQQGGAQAIAALRERVAAEYQTTLESEHFDLTAVSRQLTEALQEFTGDAEVQISWSDMAGIRLPDPVARVLLRDGEFETSPEYKGHGLLRLYEMALLGLLSDAGRRPEEPVAEVEPVLVIAIDEPELYQHPVQARLVAARLRRLAGANLDGVRCMVIATTHSPLFIAIEEAASIRCIRRGNPGRVGGTPTVNEANLVRIGEDIWPGAGLTADATASRLRVVFGPQVSESFFADFVVIVEGVGDVGLMQGILEAMGQTERFLRSGVMVVDVNGKSNLCRLAGVLRALGIPHYLVCDSDIKRPGDPEPDHLNELRRVFGLREPVNTSGGHVFSQCAVMTPNWPDAIAASIGEAAWQSVRDEVATEIGFVRPSDANKKPDALRRIARALYPRQQLPDYCLAVVGAIAAAARLQGVIAPGGRR